MPKSPASYGCRRFFVAFRVHKPPLEVVVMIATDGAVMFLAFTIYKERKMVYNECVKFGLCEGGAKNV